jgi:predicted metalloprotease
VLVGEQLFSELMKRTDDGGMTVIAICAHEFGHIHQMRAGYQDDLQRLDKTVRPIELHADYLAGYFLALRKKDHPDLNLQDVGRTFYRLGDTDFTAPQHHGTAQERVAAITAGYDLGRKESDDIDQVAKAGVDYVRRVV